MELASKGSISFSPKLEWFLAALFLFLGVLGLETFGFWVEGNEVNSPFHKKNEFLCCLRVLAPQALARRWPGASSLTSGASRRWLGAVPALAPVFWRLQALARRW